MTNHFDRKAVAACATITFFDFFQIKQKCGKFSRVIPLVGVHADEGGDALSQLSEIGVEFVRGVPANIFQM